MNNVKLLNMNWDDVRRLSMDVLRVKGLPNNYINNVNLLTSTDTLLNYGSYVDLKW